MKENEIKSVLVFYSIENDAILDMKFNDIWEKFVLPKIEGVSCRNVFHFESTPEELSVMLKSKNIPIEIFSSIKSEFDLGANVVFISPVVGHPIDGLLAHNFLPH